MSNTPVMDSPEVLGHALCRHVPDMRKGFTIQTRHGDIYVTADDAAPFADAMERLLMSKIRQIQGEGSPERDQQLYQGFKGNSLIELTERLDIASFKGLAESIHRGAEATDNTLSPEEVRIVSDALVKLVRRIHAGGRTAPGVFGALSILYHRGFFGPVSTTTNIFNGVMIPKSASQRINEIWEAALRVPAISATSHTASSASQMTDQPTTDELLATLSDKLGEDYVTQYMSKYAVNLLLDAIRDKGMEEKHLAPFRNGINSREQAQKLKDIYIGEMFFQDLMAALARGASVKRPTRERRP